MGEPTGDFVIEWNLGVLCFLSSVINVAIHCHF